jgi:hypothetical protein
VIAHGIDLDASRFSASPRLRAKEGTPIQFECSVAPPERRKADPLLLVSADRYAFFQLRGNNIDSSNVLS